MEDEDIAPYVYVHTANPVGMDRKSRQTNCIPVLKYSCTGMTFCPCRLDQLLVFGAISLSSILRPILFTTYYSMGQTFNSLVFETFQIIFKKNG